MIDDVLNAPRPNAARIAAIDPQLLADIAGVPIAATRLNHLRQSMHHIALAIGVVKPPCRELTLRDLHEIAIADERALIVLAAIGRPAKPWSRMNRQERAALLLGKIVRAKRSAGQHSRHARAKALALRRQHDQLRSHEAIHD